MSTTSGDTATPRSSTTRPTTTRRRTSPAASTTPVTPDALEDAVVPEAEALAEETATTQASAEEASAEKTLTEEAKPEPAVQGATEKVSGLLKSARTSLRERVEAARSAARAKQVDVAPAPAANATPAATPTTTVSETDGDERSVVLAIRGLVKRYGSTVAVENLDLEIRAGSFYGIVGPNGAGKTTTLSMATGLLRPDAGSVEILGTDVWSTADAGRAKRSLGVLPDRLRLFDKLTGGQFLYYAGVLRGLDAATARKRSADLADAFGLHDALGRLVSDYSVGMTKKVALAAAIIHSPRLLVLDEPFESVDPVSAATVTEILQRYVRGGGTVLLSSHSMDLVERICDSVAVIVDGHVLAQGTVNEVRAGRSLQERFVELAGGSAATEGMEWLHSFSD